jgi:hypothetical protein
MKATKAVATYNRLRSQPHWRLLAADNGPIIIGLLQTHLLENEHRLPASIFYERINRDLEELRAQGDDIPLTAQLYVADWLNKGYLNRRFPKGAMEEEYEISSSAASAIRFVISLIEPRTVATESRLATVIHQLVRLSEETDTNPETRIAALMAEKTRIDREIEAINLGQMESLPDSRALERIREIIALTDELVSDFRHVRDEFENLNRDLRIRIMDNDGSRGEVLDTLFAGVDLISESDAGRTFSAFWRLLTDPEQNLTLDDALQKIMSRNFINELDLHQRRFLSRLTNTLLEQSGAVHEVLQHFARSLKHFVQSREYLEQRRLNFLFKEAQRSAVALKEVIKITDTLNYSLTLTSSRLESFDQWRLHDPSLHMTDAGMRAGEVPAINIDSISNLVAESEIDFRTLKYNIKKVLQDQLQATIATIINQFPPSQGLGSIVGYLALGSRHGVRVPSNETVSWLSKNGQLLKARIPIIYFLREKNYELD